VTRLIAGAAGSTETTPAPRKAGDSKEIRLALVCYGGSSLAVYMHGVTKELHRLVKGSGEGARSHSGNRRREPGRGRARVKCFRG
jgi:hypothetical protein